MKIYNTHNLQTAVAQLLREDISKDQSIRIDSTWVLERSKVIQTDNRNQAIVVFVKEYEDNSDWLTNRAFLCESFQADEFLPTGLSDDVCLKVVEIERSYE